MKEAIQELYNSILHDYVETAKKNHGKIPTDIEECKPLRLLIDYMKEKYKL